MKTKTIFRIVLVVAVVFLAILATRSILRPEKFKSVYEARKNVITERLIAIRAIQTVYKNEYKNYCADMDSMVNFVTEGHINVVKNIGEVPEGMTEADAFKAGLLRKETVSIPVKERIIEIEPTANLTDFQYIPFATDENKQKKTFSIQVDSIASKTYTIPVYRIEVPIEDILSDMDKSINTSSNIFSRLINKIFYGGLAEESQYKLQYEDIWMGSLTEASTTGSWE